MKNKKGFVRQLKFRPAFEWEEEINTFVRAKIANEKALKGIDPYILNVPCGNSKIGHERLDLDPKLSMKEAYDFFKDKLPYEKNTFDIVISDPPWKIGHYFRPKLFFSLVDVCKIGGLIIYNATWIPESKLVDLEETYIRQSSSFSNVSVISVFRKTKDVL